MDLKDFNGTFFSNLSEEKFQEQRKKEIEEVSASFEAKHNGFAQSVADQFYECVANLKRPYAEVALREDEIADSANLIADFTAYLSLREFRFDPKVIRVEDGVFKIGIRE